MMHQRWRNELQTMDERRIDRREAEALSVRVALFLDITVELPAYATTSSTRGGL